MSVILIDKKTRINKQIKINSQFISTAILKRLSVSQLNCDLIQLKFFHQATEKQYNQSEVIRQGDKIQYIISNKYQILSTEQRKKGIIYPEDLQKIIEQSKIIVIKSANQQNIQKSKQLSLWATTYSNQERLKFFYHNFSHVLLIFATNRSYQIKGIARMESQPDKIVDKSIWAGVANIRLGGNFKIKWLRKKALSLVTVQKSLGTLFKQSIIKSCDGQQLDPNSCKKLAYIFQIPQEPYYSKDDKIGCQKYKEGENTKIEKQQKQIRLPFSIKQYIPNFFDIRPPQTLKTNQQRAEIQRSRDNESFSHSQISDKKKKIKKQKKKKDKERRKSKKEKNKKKKKIDYSQSQSSSNQDSSSDQSSASRYKRKRKDKNKNKKRHKRRES